MDKEHLKLTKSWLSQPIRRSIMAILFLSFFIISPLIILYTAGYRYDFLRGRIHQTGVLSIDIEPEDAQVYLDDIKIEKNIPVRLPNRAPGTYNLKIKKENYKTWEKNITISSNQTTYIKDVTLLKNSEPQKILENIQDIYGTPNGNNILFLEQKNNIYEISSFDTVTEMISPIIRTVTKPIVETSPFHDIAYIFIEEENTLHIVPLNNPENSAAVTLPSTKISFQWNESNGLQPIFINDGKKIESISLSGQKSLIQNSTSSIWYVDNKNNLWTIEDKYLVQNGDDKSYYVGEGVENIVHVNGNRFILELEDKILVAKYDEEKIYNQNSIDGNISYFQTETKEWWVNTEWELSSIYEDGGANLLNRGGEKIQDTILLDRDGVILFITEKGLKTLNPGYYVGHELLDWEVNNAIALLTQRELYFLHTEEGKNKLYKLEY